MAAQRKVFVVGVGMTKFEKPGCRENFDYPQMVKEAVTRALADCGLKYSDIEQACVGYVFGDTSYGQKALYGVGMTGIPIFNVNNACATGSSALVMARNFIKGGISDCVLAVGFDKMERGPIKGSTYKDRVSAMSDHLQVMNEERGITSSPVNPQMFGNAGREHMEKYGTKPEHFAKIAYKNHKHSVNNPYSQFRDEYTVEQIMKSRMIYEPLTLLECCPTSDGSGAAILASEDFVKKHGLEAQAVEIVAQAMTTDQDCTFTSRSMMNLVGYDMTKRAAESVYRQAGITPEDVDVIELHDCFAANELITYEALGLCPPGKAGEFIDKGDNTYGGKYVINPSGGLLSKGHPLGATGLAQCAELCWQLRGQADKRQVQGAKLALQHNLGLGGVGVVTLYKLGWPHRNHVNRSRISSVPTSSAEFKATPLFQLLDKAIELGGVKYLKKIKGVYCVKVTNGPNGETATWVIDTINGSVKRDENGKGEVTVTLADNDFEKLVRGTLKPEQAFFQGKIKVAGNLSLLMKLRQFENRARGLLSKL